MKKSFKKISAVLTSFVMLGATMGFAAAANFPAPFKDSGMSGTAVVYGANAAASDKLAAESISDYLSSKMSSTGGDVTGESAALFTSGSKIYMNASLNGVKEILTDSDLPTILADGKFSGDANADITQYIKIGSTPQLVYGKHPTSDDDPTVAISTSTTPSTGYTYNATVIFDTAINATHSDSTGETLSLFGRTYTIGADSTSTKLYLYESSETLGLSVGGTEPASKTVTVEGETYTVELVTASDTQATIKVTDSSGNSETKTITEDDSKEVQGVEVAVSLADEDTATNRLLAELTVGTSKILLQDGSSVKVGSDETIVDGTEVDFGSGNPGALTEITIQIAAEDDDVDAILPGDGFVDPVFKSFQVYFKGLGTEDRETIEVKASGNDKATVKFTPHSGSEKSVNWYYNDSASAQLADSGGDQIKVMENTLINGSQYVMVGNEDEGYLLEASDIDNQTDGYSDDTVTFKDVLSDKTYDASITAEGTGTVTIGGKQYTVTYTGDSSTSNSNMQVRLNYPDSSGNDVVIYPTIQTSLGAKLALYEPITVNATDIDGSGTDLDELQFPDGDGYTAVDLDYDGDANLTIDGGTTNLTAAGDSDTATVGQLTYNFTYSSADTVVIYLVSPEGGNIDEPAVVIFEEQDDSTSQAYEAVIVEMEGSGTSDASVGVNDVIRTWSADGQWDELQLESNDDMYAEMDYWGTEITIDKSESDQYSAMISYPDEQVFGEVYVVEEGGVSGGSGGDMVYMDTEAGWRTKNVVLVGGSCINSATAEALGTGAVCEAAWTSATGISENMYLIQSVGDAFTDGKIALVVAGYSAADTTAAADKLTTATNIDTGAGKKYTGVVGAEGTSVLSSA